MLCEPCQCGAGCDFRNDNRPCWGSVDAVDEVKCGDDDYAWVHVCEGHNPLYFGGEYKKEKEP